MKQQQQDAGALTLTWLEGKREPQPPPRDIKFQVIEMSEQFGVLSLMLERV